MPFRYFAYGSNMFTPKMRRAAPSAVFSAVARLPGHRLAFNKLSNDGSGKGNIIPTSDADAEVWGVIFEIADQGRVSLDDSEGGYAPITINVSTAHGTRTVLTYIAKAHRVDDALRPYTWYKELVVTGAQEHALPQTYRDALTAVIATRDPNPAREAENLALLVWPKAH